MPEPDAKKLRAYANFLYEAGTLAHTPRAGFRFLGDWRQSVAEHLCRTAYIGFVLAHMQIDRGESIEIGAVLECCLFHDLGEARALDLDYVSQKYSQSDELQAVTDAVKDLPFGQRIVDSFVKTEERSTPEAIIAKDADQLELLFSLREVIDTGNKQAERWIPNLLERLRTQAAKDLAGEVVVTDPHEWWQSIGDKAYWRDGGKRRGSVSGPAERR